MKYIFLFLTILNLYCGIILQKKKENIEPEQPEKKMRPSITNVCVLKFFFFNHYFIQYIM